MSQDTSLQTSGLLTSTHSWWYQYFPESYSVNRQRTLEAEIRRITVQGQPVKKVCKTLSQQKQLAEVVYTCHPSNYEKHKIGRSQSKLGWAKSPK
jgi:hypothetical protein